MKRINAQSLSGYNKLPKKMKWDDCQGFTERHQFLYEEYRKIESIWDGYFNMITGYISSFPKCKIYSTKYINKYVKKNGIDNLYYDYSPNILHSKKYCLHISSMFLTYGLQKIDGNFAQQIRCLNNEDCLFTYEELKECILRQPNLHPIIRSNLYHNLEAHK